MSVSKLARKVRCSDVLSIFLKGGNDNIFLTLTTKDVVTLLEIRQRWRNLRHYIVERLGRDCKYVMNYELHPRGHGWHIHAVFNRYINLRGDGLRRLQSFGFGRINVKRVSSVGVSDYLSKHCLKAYRGVKKGLASGGKRLRLVNQSRGLPVLSDYSWRSRFLEDVRRLLVRASEDRNFSSLPFSRRYFYAELGVLHAWDVRRLLDFVEDLHIKKGNTIL